MRIPPRALPRFHRQTRQQLLRIEPATFGSRSIPSWHRSLSTNLNSRATPDSSLLSTSTSTPVPESFTSISGLTPQQPQWSSKILPEERMPSQTGKGLIALPVTCPGCGALTQEVDDNGAGFYTRSRRSVKDYTKDIKRLKSVDEGDGQLETTELDAQPEQTPFKETFVEPPDPIDPPKTVLHRAIPFCDRCHYLQHQSKGVPIAHPTIDSIADTIAESPHRQNHIYHVLDAADFPMSFIPRIFRDIGLSRQRSQNRRSSYDFSAKPTLSFIITRSDLLAPRKEMVDSLMPYFQNVLRQALGRQRQDMRLGNVHLVSSKRGWWTKDIKAAIYERGGGNWMVGKFNVGKSNLFEVLFPKGHGDTAPVYSQLVKDSRLDQPAPDNSLDNNEPLLTTSLLPPPQPLTPYPTLPLVSSLPGTTASPIRLPFGPPRSPKGELIDLPGLARPNLSGSILPDHNHLLQMENRPTVTQHVLKPGQSLLLGGGLIRITPSLPINDISPTAEEFAENPFPTTQSDPENDLTFLIYPFVPLPSHVTATAKAILAQTQQRESGITSLLRPDVGETIQHAGTFALETDVTRSRAGAMLRAGVRVEQLPFRVLATDVLIEGVGWVEIVCQVRKRRRKSIANTNDRDDQPLRGEDALSALERSSQPKLPDRPQRPNMQRPIPGREIAEFPVPKISIHTPHGSCIGNRPSMNAWMLIHGPGQAGQTMTRKGRLAASGPGKTGRTGNRPRRSMKGVKKQEKKERREKLAGRQETGPSTG